MINIIKLVDIIYNYYYKNDTKYIQKKVDYSDINIIDIIKENNKELDDYIKNLINKKFIFNFKLDNKYYYTVNFNNKKILLIINTNTDNNNNNRKNRYFFNSNLKINYFFMIGIMNFNINKNSNNYNNFIKNLNIKNLNIKNLNNIQVDIVENFYNFKLLSSILNELKLSEVILILVIINYTLLKLTQY